MLGKGKEFRGVRRVSGTHVGEKKEKKQVEEIGGKRRVSREVNQASNSWVNQRGQI